MSTFTNEVKIIRHALEKSADTGKPSFTAEIDKLQQVLDQPVCQVTGNDGGKEYSFLTEVEELPNSGLRFHYTHLFAASRGIEVFVERLINRARTTGPLDAQAIIDEIEAVKQFNLDHHRIKTSPAELEKLLGPKLTDCPYCKHAMTEHKYVGAPWSVERRVQCSCGCNDDQHPILIDLKDRTIVATGLS